MATSNFKNFSITRADIISAVMDERFWSKVDKSGDCWEWIACKTKAGYGQYSVNGSREYTHRLSWEYKYGPITSGIFVCHKCDNPACINPEHLFLGTQKDNMGDCHAKGRGSKPPIHYGESHPMSKLTEEEVIRIRSFSHLGPPGVGKLFGISRQLAGAVLKRQIWKHI